MMILEIDNFEQFKVFFDVVYDITELIELQLFRDYMVCSILDKAHTRFMSVKFISDFFAVYEVNDAESVTLFADDMHTIIKSANKIDNVILETNDDYLICKIEGQNGNSRVFEFVLPADYIESPMPPSLSLPVTLNLNISDLKQGLKDLKIIGASEVKFTASDNTLMIMAGNEVTSKYVSNINVNTEIDGAYSSRFTIEYIEQLLKFDKINKVVEFKMGDDYPLLYSFKDDIMGVEVEGMIAPRMELED